MPPKSCRIGERTLLVDIPNVRGSWLGLEGPAWIEESWLASEITKTIWLRLLRDSCRIQHMSMRKLEQLRRGARERAQMYAEGSAYFEMYSFYFYHATNELARRFPTERLA